MEVFFLFVIDVWNDDCVLECVFGFLQVFEVYCFYGYYDILVRVSVEDFEEFLEIQREFLNIGRVFFIEILICVEGVS